MHKHKLIQIQIHEYKYKSTNTQLQTAPIQRVGQGGWPPHFRKSHDKPKPKWATSKKKMWTLSLILLDDNVQKKKNEIGLRNILTLNQLEWAQGGFKGLFGFESIQLDLDNQIYRTCEVQYMNPLKMKINVVLNQAPLPLISPVGRASKCSVWGHPWPRCGIGHHFSGWTSTTPIPPGSSFL